MSDDPGNDFRNMGDTSIEYNMGDTSVEYNNTSVEYYTSYDKNGHRNVEMNSETRNVNTGGGYRVYRNGNNVIYTGKISKEGCADFHRATLEAVAELDKKNLAKKINNAKKPPVITTSAAPPAPTPVVVTQPAPSAPGECPAPTTKVHPNIVDKNKLPSKAGDAGTIGVGFDESVSNNDSVTSGNSAGTSSTVTTGNAGGNTISGSGTGGNSNENSNGDNVLKFHFTSAGGNLPAGVAMMDAVNDASRRYETQCYSKGFVGSAATFPAFACHKRFAPEHTLFLLHPPAKSGVSGQTEDLQIHAENLDLWHETSLNIYKKLVRFSPVTTAQVLTNCRGNATSSSTPQVGIPFTGTIGGGGAVSSNASQNPTLVAGAIEKISKIFKDNRYTVAKDVKEMGLIDVLTD